MVNFNNNILHYGTETQKLIERLDETWRCFLWSLGCSSEHIKVFTSEKIGDILSLQNNGLYLWEDGEWRIIGKKKQGGKINMQKMKDYFLNT